ncbi:MAG: DUF3995 domain-containing protein [Sulfurimonas sp.]|jgi:hypothetical protein
MNYIAIFTIILLIVIALFHIYWVFGGKIGLDKALPTTLDGKKIINPNKFLTFMVAFVLLGFTFVTYKLQFDNQQNYYGNFGWFISVIFTLRSIGEFNAVGFFKKIKSTEFAKYDTRYFSPLCLYLGLSFAGLSYVACGN